MRNERDIRDRNLRLIGRTHRRADGRVELRDASGRLRGAYDAGTDETRDAAGRLVGRGDQLGRLLSKR